MGIEVRLVEGDAESCDACRSIDTVWHRDRPTAAAHFELRAQALQVWPQETLIDTLIYPHHVALDVYQMAQRSWDGGPPGGPGYWTDEEWLADLLASDSMR